MVLRFGRIAFHVERGDIGAIDMALRRWSQSGESACVPTSTCRSRPPTRPHRFTGMISRFHAIHRAQGLRFAGAVKRAVIA